jgi:cob(I)alamin adenosyltransferase
MRLSKITTRTGDDGSTGLANGSRISKDSARIRVIGTVDELNSNLGVLLVEQLPADIRAELVLIQNDLIDLGGALATPGAPLESTKLARMETAIAGYNANLPPLKEFILPGGARAAALCHVARTVARRAECDIVALRQDDVAPQHALPYINRLSDLLFILSRILNQSEGKTDSYWQHKER